MTIQFCETHQRHVPKGYRSSTQIRVDGKWVPRPNTCAGYGEVEYIDSDGWADLDRRECKIVDYEAAG